MMKVNEAGIKVVRLLVVPIALYAIISIFSLFGVLVSDDLGKIQSIS